MATKQVVNDILDDLISVKENLLMLSDDIWNSIDHNDTKKMREDVEFKEAFNKVFEEYRNVSDQIAVLVRQFTGYKEEEIENVSSDSENERIIKDLNKEEPHSISENFTYKRPFAYTLCGKAFLNTTTWKDIYISFLKYLYKVNSEKFTSFLDNEDFVSVKLNKDFSKKKEELRVPAYIDGDIFAEINFSAAHIARNIRKIMKEYNLSEDQIVIYLRKDLNA